jgi:hypothetical protein
MIFVCLVGRLRPAIFRALPKSIDDRREVENSSR